MTWLESFRFKIQSEPFRSLWIFTPAQDGVFILFTPLLILLSISVAQRVGRMDVLISFGLALAMAHYLPGILRAYSDPQLFHRFRLRLVVAPVFLIAITLAFAYLNLHIIILITLLWGAWHWMMQIFGFARIYDAKFSARTPASLDRMICLLWFGMCIFVLNNDLPNYVRRFYESGGPWLPFQNFAWFRQGWLVLTIAGSLFYGAYTLRDIRHGRRPNPLKFILILISFVYLKYTASVFDRPLMGLIMFESWHDIQYLAVVWWFNVNRTRQGSVQGALIRLLFRPRAILVFAYVAICLAFGSLAHAWSLFENPAAVRLANGFVTATALLHYYLDGFIWKIRDDRTRQTLLGKADHNESQGLEHAQRTSAPLLLTPNWARHAFLWLLFVVPASLFFVIESRGNVPTPLQIDEALVNVFPDSPDAQNALGRDLQEVGRLREAKIHFQRAIMLAPDMLPAHIFLGVLLSDQGDLDGARTHFEKALALEPRSAETHNNLGMVLAEQENVRSAKEHLELALDINPQYALAHNNLGILLSKTGDLAQARVHYEQAVQLEPDFADALYQLGVTMAAQGETTAAISRLEQALRADPEHYLAHNSLGVLLANTGRLSEARIHFQQAVQIRPDYIEAQRNLAATLQDVRVGISRKQ